MYTSIKNNKQGGKGTRQKGNNISAHACFENVRFICNEQGRGSRTVRLDASHVWSKPTINASKHGHSRGLFSQQPSSDAWGVGQLLCGFLLLHG